MHFDGVVRLSSDGRNHVRCVLAGQAAHAAAGLTLGFLTRPFLKVMGSAHRSLCFTVKLLFELRSSLAVLGQELYTIFIKQLVLS